MKKLFFGLAFGLCCGSAFSQVQSKNLRAAAPATSNLLQDMNMPDSLSQPLDSNEAYRQVKNGYVVQAGHLDLDINGYLIPQHSPVTLKNGSIVMTNGLIQMTNGSTPLLRQEDFIDLNGNILPLQKHD